MRLRFLSSNGRKVEEVRDILSPVGIEVVPVARKLDEIQTQDIEQLVRDKCIRAFRLIGRPVFVEHTGLYIEAMNGFPGGLTQLFWDTLGAERVTALFGREDGRAHARTRIGYCDGCRIHQFEGEVEGNIAAQPRGDPAEWDCIFVPTGERESFAEMRGRKNDISMRRKALDAFAAFLRGGAP
jgi:XTP/dITP diphosphohydrolase